jgi:serine/threonine-protein kinase HipA
MERLSVRWGDRLVGHLYRKEYHRVEFEYSDEWLSQGFPRISYSLPTAVKRHDAERSTAFFANMRLEGPALSRAVKVMGNPIDVNFRYFGKYGLDCAGALSVGPEGWEAERPADGYRDVTDRLEAFLAEPVTLRPPAVAALGAELSVAGFQDKIPLYHKGGRFLLPEHGSDSPTTVILKTQAAGIPFLPENERLCLSLASRIGLPVAVTELIDVGGEIVLVSERFDRLVSGDTVARLHQEDFCQALSLMPDLKYQLHDAMGPSFARCTAVISACGMGDDGGRARDDLIRLAVFNLIVGNCDAHAKNLALLYRDHAEGVTLAPFYDIVSTRAYPETKPCYAMYYGGSYTLEAVDGAALRRFAGDMGTGPRELAGLASGVIAETAARIDDAVSGTCAESPKAEALLVTIRRRTLDASKTLQRAVDSLG